MTTIVTPIVRVGRGRGRVMTRQVTIEWAMVGHLAMEAHENGPPWGRKPSRYVPLELILGTRGCYDYHQRPYR